MWAAENYGVNATGITLSKNQHAHVQRLIEEKGLQGRVRMELRDYREMDEAEGFDKIASVGMFEHVGQVNMPAYFGKIFRLLKPGGLVMNHGITAGSIHPGQLGAGMGEFIEKYIFPGGELLHVSHVLREMAVAGLEMVDAENLRPHYARTLWAWSDALEERLRRGPARAGDDGQRRRCGQGAAGLPPLPGRLRDDFRAGLDRAAPDPGNAAGRTVADRLASRRTIGLSLQSRVHVPAAPDTDLSPCSTNSNQKPPVT